jgi:hypothetical protein
VTETFLYKRLGREGLNRCGIDIPNRRLLNTLLGHLDEHLQESHPSFRLCLRILYWSERKGQSGPPPSSGPPFIYDIDDLADLDSDSTSQQD